MKRAYQIIRALFVTALVLSIAVPSLLYVLLSIPSVQRDICHTAETELTQWLGMKTTVKDISITPFSRVTLYHVNLLDTKGDTAISIDRIGAGLNLFDLIAKRRIVFNYAELIGLEANIYKDSLNAPLNIQPMIDALAPKDKNKPPTQFNLAIRTIVIRNSAISYNVFGIPAKPSGLDINHLSFRHIRADISIPLLHNDDFAINLRRLALSEQSGLTLDNLRGEFHVSSTTSSINGLEIEFPHTSLKFNDISLDYQSFETLKTEWGTIPAHISLLDGSYLTLSDMAWCAPTLASLDFPISLAMNLHGDAEYSDIDITASCATPQPSASSNFLTIHMTGSAGGWNKSVKDLQFDIPSINIRGSMPDAVNYVSKITTVSPKLTEILGNLGNVDLNGHANGSMNSLSCMLELSAAPGTLTLTAQANKNASKSTKLTGELTLSEFNIGSMLKNMGGNISQFGELTMQSQFDLTLKNKFATGNIDIAIPELQYRGIPYTDIKLHTDIDNSHYYALLESAAEGLDLKAEGELEADGTQKNLQLSLDINNVNLAALGIFTKYHGYTLTGNGTAILSGSNLDNIEGDIALHDISFLNTHNSGAVIDSIMISSKRYTDAPDTITLQSPIASGIIYGEYKLSSIAKCVKGMIAKHFPALLPQASENTTSIPVSDNNFQYSFTIKDTSPFSELIKLPVTVIYPIEASGDINSAAQSLNLKIEAPYLQQKDKLIEHTALHFNISGDSLAVSPVAFYCTTQMPTKNGDMTLVMDAAGGNDHIDTRLQWLVNRARTFKGDVNLSAQFSRPEDNIHSIDTKIFVNPGQMVFNDTAWHISPSTIDLVGKRAEFRDFRIGHDSQYLVIDGIASQYPTDSLTMTLKDVNLNYIFETLGIEAAMFGGNATGKFYAKELFSPRPKAYTPDLYVERFSYNSTVLGDTHIQSQWIPESKAITLIADVKEADGRHSYVDGKIMPMCDSLDFKFKADRLPVGFLRPFMSAFADDISGYASGTARLWGTFKLIDMVGDIYGEDVTLKLGFTNTTYTTTDSIHLTPGRIDLRNIPLRDIYGHTAKLNGWVTHEFFKNPRFSFNITDASDMLVYDVKENTETNWYGRIFGNGSASINGYPGVVNIGVNMSTAPNSTFTFVLSDAKQATDYTFITFRDRDQAFKDSIAAQSTIAVVRDLKKKISASTQPSEPSVYDMNIAIDVTPQAQMTLVMDPAGGDCIRANGRGNLRMNYNSKDEELHMFGTYTLERGSYNFTLQDIIIKEFTIKPGSSIVFHGDPYAAQLNINATYAVNANLSDLDESFLEDKDLNRTNVPVHALLMVKGDMRQPDIDFDLEFPTLTSDTYRKVRSIVSTDEMMNRQIIYLLALNRFYTPDYVSATRGNELVSVASSTLSSRIGNMLGQLSDNWNIAPNLRSDRGDFSDVEFDLALSSHLLNNRLLFNGNFGYRDKSLNNNSFIGDFDIEYLINRSGSIRLKAYNRYNDQNYYVKSALTTQGVGVVFKRDFDNMLSFLRPLNRLFGGKNRGKQTLSQPVDSTDIKK